MRKYQLKEETISIITPPIFGYIIYFVPDKNALHGMEIILMKTLGMMIFNTVAPSIKISPKKDKTNSEIKNKLEQSIVDNKNIIEEVFLKISNIFSFRFSPNNFENSGRNTCINNFGKNIKIDTIDNAAV